MNKYEYLVKNFVSPYNFIENTHQLWLLTVCDLIIGKREYLPN